jgi:hypothetical protein
MRESNQFQWNFCEVFIRAFHSKWDRIRTGFDDNFTRFFMRMLQSSSTSCEARENSSACLGLIVLSSSPICVALQAKIYHEISWATPKEILSCQSFRGDTWIDRSSSQSKARSLSILQPLTLTLNWNLKNCQAFRQWLNFGVRTTWPQDHLVIQRVTSQL